MPLDFSTKSRGECLRRNLVGIPRDEDFVGNRVDSGGHPEKFEKYYAGTHMPLVYDVKEIKRTELAVGISVAY